MKTLLTETQLHAGVDRLAAEISKHYGTTPLTVLGVMTGSIILIADLIRRLSMPLQIGVVQASSYREGADREGLRLNGDFLPRIANRHVLLVDDILDTGHTLLTLQAVLSRQQPASLRTAVLLKKSGRQEVVCPVEHIGFEIPDQFVVGYGLDFRDHFRQLPYLAALEPDDLQRGLPT